MRCDSELEILNSQREFAIVQYLSLENRSRSSSTTKDSTRLDSGADSFTNIYLTGARFANALASFRRNLLGALPMRRALRLCICGNLAHQCSDFTWSWSTPI